MPFQIREIVLYGPEGKQRRLRFKLGKVNIITGRSGTGKSALVPILDYCLCRSTFTVPEGVIRDRVTWYGVLLEVRAGTQIFIAKPAPAPNALSQSKAMFQIGTIAEPPAFELLEVNSNDDAVEKHLSRELGISPNLNVPGEGQTRHPLSATIAHTKFYLFQEQGTVASRDLLFFRQSEPFFPQTIKDTLPYLLGAIEEEHLERLEEFRRLQREIKLLERDLAEQQAIAGGGINTARALVSEAIQSGLTLQQEIPSSALELQRVLRGFENWTPASLPIDVDQRSPRIRAELRELRQESRTVADDEQAALAFSNHASGYTQEVAEQTSRLTSIQLIPTAHDPASCPFCGTRRDDLAPAAQQLIRRLEALDQQLSTVSQHRPRLVEHLNALAERRIALRQAIRQKETELAAVEREDARAEAVADRNSRIARVLGRISLYLESASNPDTAENIRESLDRKKVRARELERMLERGDALDVLASILNRMGTDMTRLAAALPFEHHAHPMRFDLKALTVVADRPGRPFPMQRMGSAQNWLVCHLVVLFALHSHFRAAKRPVPAFLILDQPSQVYFPSEAKYKAADGSVKTTRESGADLSAVEKMFKLFYAVVKELKGEFQLIVLEHANLDQDDYQAALVEEPWNGTDRALVPPAWEAS